MENMRVCVVVPKPVNEEKEMWKERKTEVKDSRFLPWFLWKDVELA